MIWNPPQHGDEQSEIISHITAGISELCGQDIVLDEEDAAELARAVQFFVEQEADAPWVDSNVLLMLASSALSSLGHGLAARRLYLFGTGLVRPARWEATGADTMWVLDLREIMVRDSVPLELMLFGSLCIILEALSEVWDESRGHGVLGLRHVCDAAARLSGSTRPKDVTALAAEIQAVCRDKLAQIGEDRNWTDVPHLVNLDF